MYRKIGIIKVPLERYRGYIGRYGLERFRVQGLDKGFRP